MSSGRTRGISGPVCMRSSTRSRSRRPIIPAGWIRARSSGLIPRFSIRLIARASLRARAAVVLAVGERPSGQASSETEASRMMSAEMAREDFGLPVMAMSFRPSRLMIGRISSISSVSPELDRATTMSRGERIPRPPWTPSVGWRNAAGVPVEERVAANLWAMIPDFPKPVTTTFPSQERRRSTAARNRSSRRSTRLRMASASVRSTFSALAIGSTWFFFIVYPFARVRDLVRRSICITVAMSSSRSERRRLLVPSHRAFSGVGWTSR